MIPLDHSCIDRNATPPPAPIDNSEYSERYLQYIAELDITLKEKYELLSIVNLLLSYFVDQAFNVQTDQLTLAANRKMRFNAPLDCAMIGTHPEHQSTNVQSNGVEGESNPIGQNAP